MHRPPADRQLPGMTDTGKLVAEHHSVIVLAKQRIFKRQEAGENARPHHTRLEPRAFLIGEIGDLDCAPRGDACRIERADNRNPGKHAQHAIKLAARHLRVEMAADHQRRQRRIGPFPPREHVADSIDSYRQPRLLRPVTEQVTSFAVRIRKRGPETATALRRADRTHRHDIRPEALGVDFRRGGHGVSFGIGYGSDKRGGCCHCVSCSTSSSTFRNMSAWSLPNGSGGRIFSVLP
ncbi:hypothetical protein D3C80_861220 [compost metagenome]